jgi:hypothetical protein
MTSREAVEFFALKIKQEAARENVLLTHVEQLMLRSGVDAEGGEDPKLYDQFEQQSNDDEFESKTASLLLHAFARERGENASTEEWEQAKSALGGFDHYILVTVWRAFPELKPNFSPVRKPSSISDQLIYLAIALAIVGILLCFGLRRGK